MTAIGITGPGLTGTLRMTWVQDDLAHVLEHSHADETQVPRSVEPAPTTV
jgi:hypothetical protein